MSSSNGDDRPCITVAQPNDTFDGGNQHETLEARDARRRQHRVANCNVSNVHDRYLQPFSLNMAVVGRLNNSFRRDRNHT